MTDECYAQSQTDHENDLKEEFMTAGEKLYNDILTEDDRTWEQLSDEERKEYCQQAYSRRKSKEKQKSKFNWRLNSKEGKKMDKQEIITVDNDITLIDKITAIDKFKAIKEFQTVVHDQMKKDKDYGVIPGTNKPTLLKPGAEKLAKLMNLADTYEIMEKTENWDKPFFNYTIRCLLTNINSGLLVSSGLGSCNSFESKYRWRWAFDNEIPSELDKSSLKTKTVHSTAKNKDYTMYRIGNDDIFSQVNTLLKMAKKRALVDAALSAGRLSDIFTQDMDDLPQGTNGHDPKPVQSKHKPQTSSSDTPDTRDISPAQNGRLHKIAEGNGWTKDQVRQVMISKYKLAHSTELKRHQYAEAVDIFEKSTPDQYFDEGEE